MSYILDALRRADAERDRGAVPTLHARHEAGPVEDDERPPRPWLALAAGGLVLVVAGALGAWWLMGSDPEPRVAMVPAGPSPVTVSPPPSTTPVAPSTAAQPSALPAPPPVAPPPPPAQATRVTANAASPAAPGPPPLAAPRARPSLAAASATAAAATRRAAAAAAAPASTSASAAPADDRSRIYAVSDLPDAVKRDLPRVAISGGSWSRDKASRMVMVNGQVLHEGDAVAPGLVLESIRLKTAVLAWKGYRYEVSY